MGEAKRKADEFRAALIKEADNWTFQESDWERATVNELARMPRVEVTRESDEKLRDANLKPKDCHGNTCWYEANDPSGRWKRVTGWWPHGDTYVLHSVVSDGVRFICLTPQERDVPRRFDFIPDAKLVWRMDDDREIFHRDGHDISVGLRGDPAAHIETMRRMKARLEQGMSAREAMKLVDEETRTRLSVK